MGRFAQDLRYGIRMLRNNPGFTITAILALTLGIVARQAFRLVAVGLATGIGLALLLTLALSRVLSDQLFGIKATDPLTFLSLAFVLSVVALAASGVPALRAMRVYPIIALRHE